MLGALKQLNSEPKVVLRKLKCIEEEVKKQAMEAKLVKKSEIKPSQVSSANLAAVDSPGLKNTDSPSKKRKASLEEVLSEADAAFFKSNKKTKKDVGTTSRKDKSGDSVEKARKSKSQKSLLKVKLFNKSHDSNSVPEPSIKINKCDKEAKGSDETSRRICQEVPVVEESSEATTSCTGSSNAILSYLRLIPKSTSDDQTDDELAGYSSGNSFLPVYQAESDPPRSDSVETVALEHEDRDNAEPKAQSKDKIVECVSLISPQSSPAAAETITAPDAQDVLHHESNDIRPASSLQLSDEQKIASNFSPTMLDPAYPDVKRSADECNSAEVGKQASREGISSESLARMENVGNEDLLKKSPDVGSTKHSTVPETLLQMETSARQSKIVNEPQRRSVSCKDNAQSTRTGPIKEHSYAANVEDLPSKSSKSAQSGVNNNSESRSFKEVPLENVVEALLQDSLPLTSADSATSAQGQSLNHCASDKISTHRVSDCASKGNNLSSRFSEGLQVNDSPLTGQDTETNNNRITTYNYEERKRALAHELEELRKAYQTLVTVAKPHDNSLRVDIAQYDAIKGQLELKQKEKETDSSQVADLTTLCESLQKKYDVLLQEKTKAQKANIETEMHLREQQMELCREQLHLGIDQKLDETHPNFHAMRARQEKVDQLTKEVAEKDAAFKASEESLTLSKFAVEKARKELEALTNRYNERMCAYEKLIKQLGAIKLVISEKAIVGRQHFEDQRRLWLKGIELRQELLRIESLERLEDLNKRRQQALTSPYIIDDMLKSRSISSNENVTSENSSSNSSANESKSETTTADEEPLPAHAVPSTLTLNELAEAVPYYANYLDKSIVPCNISTDEKLLCRNIIRGCRQYRTWKNTYVSGSFDANSLDEKTLKQGSAYIKDFFIPLFQLWTMKNTTASSVLNLIINEGFTNDWYGFPSMDPFVMRDMLETNIRDAIAIGKKFSAQLGSPTSISNTRVELKIPSSENSLVPVTITNQAQTTSECAMKESNPIAPHIKLRSTLFENLSMGNQVNGPRGANDSDVQAIHPIQTQTSALQVAAPTTIGVPTSVAAVCLTQPQNQFTASQVWSNSGVNSGIMAIQSTVVQNTAVVLPMPTAQFVNASPQFVSNITTNTPPALPQATSNQTFPISTIVSSNPPAYTPFHAVNVQYPQRMNQNSVAHFSCAQPLKCSPNSQGMISNTQQPVVPTRAQYQTQPVAQTMELQNQRIATTFAPAIQHQSTVEQTHNHLASVQRSQQQVEQQRTIMARFPVSLSSQNTNAVISRAPQQMIAQQRAPQEPLGFQSQANQMRYVCAYCQSEATQKCSGCHTVYYCDGSCQLAHWDMHRAACVLKR